MNDMQLEETSVNEKRVWTQPVVAVIKMNFAKNGGSDKRDGTGQHKS